MLNFGGLRLRLILGLSAVFLALAVWMVPWTLGLARGHFDQTHQQVNRDVARAVVEHANLFEGGAVNQKELSGVFMKLMAVNPTLELYLLDADGKILGYDAPPDAVKLDQVALGPIRTFLEHPEEVVFGADPRRPEQERVFTAWPVEEGNVKSGYVYAVLRDQAFAATTQAGIDGPHLNQAGWMLGGILLLAMLSSMVIVSYLTRDLKKVESAMLAFEEGDMDTRCEVRGQDEIGRLSQGFNFLAQSVQEQMEQVKEGDRKRREMVASISHDLRTPLASLRGYLDHLSERWPELDDVQRAEVLTIARRNTDRVQRMTEDLLELSRLESGAVRLELEDFPLGELVHDLVLRFRPEAEKQQVQLMALVPEDLPLVRADISLLERALGNLVANALRHTGAGGKVSVRVIEHEGSLEVRVIDTGEGIAEEELPRIFERFYRVAKHRDVGKGSTGLGLAIVQQILALHRATIQVNSKPTVGTVFRFRLAVSE